MPLKRAALKLDFSLLNSASESEKKTVLPADSYLKTHFDSLHREVIQSAHYHLRDALNPPDYEALRECGFSSVSHGFHLSNNCGDVFIHARRDIPRFSGGYEGDKFHISVQESQLSEAVQVLSGALFSDDNPCDKWKITDIARADPGSRVRMGAQFTLYVRGDRATMPYHAQMLSEIRQFTGLLDSRLTEAGIMQGEHPASDIRPPHWQFVSYRNEIISGRDGNDIEHQRLSESPFYRLMTA